MPIEMRELIIKVTVSEETKKTDQSKELRELENKLVKRCIEKVMSKLESLPER